MSIELDTRLFQLQNELDDHARVARYLGLDFERPIKSLGDGYPENAISLVGKITERILKQLWRHHNVPGDPGGKTLSELIKGAQPHIRSSNVLDSSATSSGYGTARHTTVTRSPRRRGWRRSGDCWTYWRGSAAPAAAS